MSGKKKAATDLAIPQKDKLEVLVDDDNVFIRILQGSIATLNYDEVMDLSGALTTWLEKSDGSQGASPDEMDPGPEYECPPC